MVICLWRVISWAIIAAAVWNVEGRGARDIPDGTYIQLWECDGSSDQLWELMSDNTIRLLNDQKCVDIEQYGTQDGSNIWLYTCHTDDKDPTHQNQEWIYNASSGTITSTMSGKCITAEGIIDGAILQLWGCNGATNQQWVYDTAGHTFRSAQSNLCMDVGSSANCSFQPWSTFDYCNYKLDPLKRAEDLVSRLTVFELVNLLLNDHDGVPRLGVPPFGHTECTHGTLNDGQLLTTLFPQALTMASSFDHTLLHSIGTAIADEVRGKYNVAFQMGKYNYPYGLICWAPVVNVCRDPRWGRCQEGYGEDPYLQGQLATQYIQGLQTTSEEGYVEAVATCKHFDVHSGPENIPSSRFTFDALVSYRDWLQTFQPAFRACAEAGVMSYMCSYNAINGVPACANRELLTDLLRNTWKFDGFVVSDCGAVENVYQTHHYAQSQTEAADFCLKAGCDWCCGNGFSYLLNATEQGYVSQDELGASVTRLMKAFIQLGVLDPWDMVPYNKIDLSVVDEHKGLALQAALEAMVLLENANNTLPLLLNNYKSVALIGPCADDPDCVKGDYDPTPKYIVTPRGAFESRTSLKVNYVSGCPNVLCTTTSGFAAAIAAAKQSDFVVYVGGINRNFEGEGNDRADIALFGLQSTLIQMLKQSNPKVIVVLMHGAPVVSPVYSQVDAVISAGYAGQEAGNAILDVVSGLYNPAGRTVVTWYTGVGQLPPMVSYSMVNRTYRYMVDTPMYYFGYGLSYTTFQYSNLNIATTSITPCNQATLQVTVTNTGKVAGDEVVQVYMTFKNATVPAPFVSLVGFTRVAVLAPGNTATVGFNITPAQMTVVRDEDFAEVIEPGEYAVYVGGHQPTDTKAVGNILAGSFVVVGSITPLNSC